MQVEICKWSTAGHEVLRTYDPETADMEEVNQYIHTLEAELGRRAFDMNSGEVVHNVTKENTNISLVPQMCGG